mmetsp:Transcript_67923/g.189695  ORF Transcript_67923/g.189695 Transcript_67923/m.189695 type:complete len:250 (+) Transcript_67923:773-1522(+)
MEVSSSFRAESAAFSRCSFACACGSDASSRSSATRPHARSMCAMSARRRFASVIMACSAISQSRRLPFMTRLSWTMAWTTTDARAPSDISDAFKASTLSACGAGSSSACLPFFSGSCPVAAGPQLTCRAETSALEPFRMIVTSERCAPKLASGSCSPHPSRDLRSCAIEVRTSPKCRRRHVVEEPPRLLRLLRRGAAAGTPAWAAPAPAPAARGAASRDSASIRAVVVATAAASAGAACPRKLVPLTEL